MMNFLKREHRGKARIALRMLRFPQSTAAGIEEMLTGSSRPSERGREDGPGRVAKEAGFNSFGEQAFITNNGFPGSAGGRVLTKWFLSF